MAFRILNMARIGESPMKGRSKYIPVLIPAHGMDSSTLVLR